MNLDDILLQFTRREKPHKLSKTINFKFGKVYQELVENIDTTDISDECILFSSDQANIFNEEFAQKDYWSTPLNTTDDKFWFFATNGHGDFWLLNEKEEVYFFDHDSGAFSVEKFIPLEINFEQWLMVAANQEPPTDEDKDKLIELLNISYKNSQDFEPNRDLDYPFNFEK